MTDGCSWNGHKILKLLEVLSKYYKLNLSEFIMGSVGVGSSDNKFEVLVAIILSQNTSDRNAIKAFNNLKSALGSITPYSILKTDISLIKDLIRVAGLADKKSRVIRELAFILSENPAFFDRLEQLGLEEARKTLLELPGIGLKTADVFLLMVLKRPTFPIDTHINRIIRRLGIASSSDNYEAIRTKVLELVGSDVEDLLMLHLLLITHGRNTCTAKNPKCSQCVIADLCCRVL